MPTYKQMPQLDDQICPAFLVAADIGLAGVLFLISPVLSVLMAAVALSVATATVFGCLDPSRLLLDQRQPTTADILQPTSAY